MSIKTYPNPSHCLRIDKSLYKELNGSVDDCLFCCDKLYEGEAYAKGHICDGGTALKVHAFHEKCIDKWILVGGWNDYHGQNNCPFCRIEFEHVDPAPELVDDIEAAESDNSNNVISKVSFLIGSAATYLVLASIINTLSLSIFPTFALCFTSAFIAAGVGYFVSQLVLKVFQDSNHNFLN